MNHGSILNEARHLLDAGRYQAAIDALLPISEAGNAEAQALLGAIYFIGPGVYAPKEALKWLKQAAEAGDGCAAHNLGTLFLTCEPEIPRNPEESQRWYQLAYDLGFEETVASDPQWFKR